MNGAHAAAAGGPVVGTDNATFLGQLVLLERDGMAAIQTAGVMLLPLTGAVVAGDKIICAANGTVKAAGAATNGVGQVLPAPAPAGFAYVRI